MRSGHRRAGSAVCLAAVAVLTGFVVLRGSPPQAAVLPAGPSPTVVVIGARSPAEEELVTIEAAELGLRRAEPAPSDDPSSASTTSEPDTTMAPSTGSTRKPATPVTLSTKRAPSGPGVPPIPPYTMSAAEQDFFACVVFRESSGNPSAINDSSGAAGLFQFLQSTWDATARHVGRGDLVGVNPALAPVDLQWWMAHMLFLWQGPSPWASDGCRYVPPSPATTPSTAPPTSPPPPTTTRPESTTTTAGRTTTTSSR